MRRGLVVAAVGVIVGLLGVGCAPSEAEGIWGPDGGVIGFDPSMIGRDVGMPDLDRIDQGTAPRDLGPPDEGSPTYACEGFALSCAGNSSLLSCSSLDGCSWREECEGSATSCFSIFSSFSCSSQSGCRWNSSTRRCSGSSQSCRSFGASSCYRQEGCRRDTDCTGVSTPCSSFSGEFSCENQTGCRWAVQ